MSAHFPDSELACRCCGYVNTSPRLLAALEAIRVFAKAPVKVHSACRCPKHNAAVGGVPNSEHLATPDHPCEAADIRIVGKPLMATALAAEAVEAIEDGGMGVYVDRAGEDFVHVDVRPYMARWGQIGKRKCTFREAWAAMMDRGEKEAKS